MRNDTYFASTGDRNRFLQRWPDLESYRLYLAGVRNRPTDYIAVIYCEGVLAGHYILAEHQNDRHCGWLEILYFRPRFRGQRLGRRTMEHIEALFRRDNYARAMTASHLARSRVTEFYRACAWRQVGYDGKEPQLIFWEKVIQR